MAEEKKTSTKHVDSRTIPDKSNALSGLGIVEVDVRVVLGATELTVSEVVSLGPDDLLSIGGSASDPVDIRVNGRLIGRGKLVVVGDTYGVQITELMDSEKAV